jgi:hypothetical protein
MTTLQDLGLAHRKAKVGQHYASHASMDAAATHEANPALKDTHHETHS